SQKTGFNLQSGEQRLTLSSGGGQLNGPVSIDGPFMIVARQIQLQSYVSLTQRNAANKNLSLSFTCFVEPKLQLSQRPYGITLTDCVDDQGRSLISQNVAFSQMADASNQIMWEANTPLKIPEPDAQRIALLR